jgi:hypothetical protein
MRLRLKDIKHVPVVVVLRGISVPLCAEDIMVRAHIIVTESSISLSINVKTLVHLGLKNSN